MKKKKFKEYEIEIEYRSIFVSREFTHSSGEAAAQARKELNKKVDDAVITQVTVTKIRDLG